MKNRITSGLLAVLLLGGLLLPSFAADPDKPAIKPGTSAWLAHDAFESFMSANLANKPLYITAAEGRLHNGVSEWRVRWVPAPQHTEWYWYWWYDSSADYYADHVQSLVPKGFDQIWLQSFVNEKGERKYQSIFLKIINKDKAKPMVTSPVMPAVPVVKEAAPVVPAQNKPSEILPGFD